MRPLVTALWNSCELKPLLVSGILTWSRNTSLPEAGIDLFYNNICPGFSQGQKKAFLPVHLFQNCRVELFLKISSYIHHDHTHAHCDDDQHQVSWKAVPSNVKLRSGSHSERLSGHWIMCRYLLHHHHHPPPSQHDHCSPPGFLVLLYMFAMGVLVVMKRKQKRDRLLREQFLNMPLPTVCRDDDHRGDQDYNDHRLLKDDFFRCKVQNIKHICTKTMQWLNNL